MVHVCKGLATLLDLHIPLEVHIPPVQHLHILQTAMLRLARLQIAHLAQQLSLMAHVWKAAPAHMQERLLSFTQVMRQQMPHLLTDMVLAAHIHRQIICRSASKVFDLLRIQPASYWEAGFFVSETE